MKKSTVKTILKSTLWVVLTAVIAINVAAALLSRLGITKQLDTLGFAALNVQGGSMAPEMSKGDLIIITAEPYSELEVGDDISFFLDKELVTHRIEEQYGSEYITRGLSNGISDVNRLKESAYCGKVVLRVPYLGNILQLLTESYIASVLAILLILLMCFTSPAIALIRAVASGKQSKRTYSILTRTLACICASSAIICTPYFTNAKYIGQLNRLELAVAQPLYFTSNYLAEGEGNKYNIQGWNGQKYNFTLQIRNYSNELLFNEAEVPIRYGLGTRICTDEGYSTDYDLVIKSSAGNIASSSFEYPDGWTATGADGTIKQFGAYEISGGAKIKNEFSVTVVPKHGDNETDPLPVNSKIAFEIFATTEQGETYVINLLSEFEMTVAPSLDFIGSKDTNTYDTMVTLNIKTNLINEGVDEKVVLFSWDPKFLYINEYESTAFNVITNNPTYFDKANGRLWMKVPAFANINLEFFKRDVNLDTDGDGIPDITPDYSIDVDVVDAVGKLPDPNPGEGGTENGGAEDGGSNP